jgi:hypothetical protein
MAHIRVAAYDIKHGSFQEIAHAAKVGLLEAFEEQPGFIRYGLADMGDGQCLSISLWETREQAEGAVPVAAMWVRENLGDRVELLSSAIGDLAFFKDVPVTA